jgi:hypothetical protein
MVSPGLASKPVVESFPIWALKSAATIWVSKSPSRFFGLNLKTNQATVLSVAAQDRWEDNNVGRFEI